MERKTAIIIGAGPAGLTAAYEFFCRNRVVPIVIEQSDRVGGISRTVPYKGNRIDIGGHRFFSRSQRVRDWWLNILPLQNENERDERISGLDSTSPKLPSTNHGGDTRKNDFVMLVRHRISRIFFNKRFFDYPLSLTLRTVGNLGIFRLIRCLFSYLAVKLMPVKPEKNLEDFFINRFGRELYVTFFRDYTKKVWGVSCDQLDASWGAQRIKTLSVGAALRHALRRCFKKQDHSLTQNKTATSLIEQFMYPKLGPGQLWEAVADKIRSKGGEVRLNQQVTGIQCEGDRVIAVEITDQVNGRKELLAGDYFFSTMPMSDLVMSLKGVEVPSEVMRIACALPYRDFITVGLLLNRLKIKNQTKFRTRNGMIPDNWIYIQEKDVRVGRVQVFNNWSPYLVQDPDTVWLGAEFFCNEGDDLWSLTDEEMKACAIRELVRIGFIESKEVLDSVVIRMKKVYPAYFGAYSEIGKVTKFLDPFENLFLIGRNGMHRYNNMDHSMLTAMAAVDNVLSDVKTKENIWAINKEQEYHE